jgi:predicted dithiol-disulfide oxidoreductase (DUF899 family)
MTIEPTITGHEIVSREEWIAAHKELLSKEVELTRLRNQLATERRALPWVKIEKKYVFDAPEGEVTSPTYSTDAASSSSSTS